MHFIFIETVPLVKRLWTGSLKHVEYYSEYADPTIPTVNLGIENTEKGLIIKQTICFHATL